MEQSNMSYKAKIANGLSFEEFALMNAREMAASFDKHEECASELPTLMEVNPVHEERLKEVVRYLRFLLDMSELERREYVDKLNRDNHASHVAFINEQKPIKEKYREMRARVEQWKPPTAGHQALKDLMIKNIDQDLGFEFAADVDPPPRRIDEMIKLQRRLVQLNEDRLEIHRENVKRQNEWVVKLYQSLGLEPPGKEKSP